MENYRAKSIKIGNYLAVKEIQKKKSGNKFLNEIEILSKIKYEIK